MSRWAVFISGRGSNLQALTEIQHDIEIALCVSSAMNVAGVLRAKRSGIPVLKIETKIGLDEWMRIHQELVKRKVSRIFLLGFMRLIPKEFVDLWQGRIFNLHPSLLPKYPGKNALEKSYQDGADLGVSVHHVIPEMDAGKIILQKKTAELAQAGRHSFSLEEAQFAISRMEQNLVRTKALWG